MQGGTAEGPSLIADRPLRSSRVPRGTTLTVPRTLPGWLREVGSVFSTPAPLGLCSERGTSTP